jgi:hypothetical protein
MGRPTRQARLDQSAKCLLGMSRKINDAKLVRMTSDGDKLPV